MPDISCCLLRLSLRVRHKGPLDGSGDPPSHVADVARVLSQYHTLINQPDGVLGHPEGSREAFRVEGDWFQGLEDMKLYIYPAEFRCGGYYEW